MKIKNRILGFFFLAGIQALLPLAYADVVCCKCDCSAKEIVESVSNIGCPFFEKLQGKGKGAIHQAGKPGKGTIMLPQFPGNPPDDMNGSYSMDISRPGPDADFSKNASKPFQITCTGTGTYDSKNNSSTGADQASCMNSCQTQCQAFASSKAQSIAQGQADACMSEALRICNL